MVTRSPGPGSYIPASSPETTGASIRAPTSRTRHTDPVQSQGPVDEVMGPWPPPHRYGDRSLSIRSASSIIASTLGSPVVLSESPDDLVSAAGSGSGAAAFFSFSLTSLTSLTPE